MESKLDAMALYQAWSKLDKGGLAKLRRAATPDQLLDIPIFYALVAPFGWPEQRYVLLRMVFCLASGVIKHSDDESLTLGRVLAQKGINQLRVSQLVRQEYPNDMVQLRRMLIHAEPVLYWPAFAGLLQWWGKYDRRSVLEQFVLSSHNKEQRKETK